MVLPPLPKALDLWLPAWLRRTRQPPSALGARHLLICVCDHFEPFHQQADKSEALRRMDEWQTAFPRLTSAFRDSKGQRPKQTFFYPIEQYDSEIVARLAELCRETGSETEIHLHHDNDTADGLRGTLELAKERLTSQGLLSRDPEGAIRYGFVHGNWALDHSDAFGRHCGVHGELAILRATGCYADFTLPSAPHRTQTQTINSLYYARSTDRPKSHNSGRRVRAERNCTPADRDELLIVQGPLGLNWRERKWGFLPRIETGDLTGANPPTPDRLQLWTECNVTVSGRPNWLFIKLHTHGAKTTNRRMLLGEPMHAFHRHLEQLVQQDRQLHYHYVTAREMVNIVHAAESGHSGDPGQFRNYRYTPVSASGIAAEPAGAQP